MAEAVAGRRQFEVARLQLQVAADWLVAHRELVAVFSLMALAAGLRFWDLGAMALHHDESLHARYAWLLYDGQGYQHNPLMHGPFLFHANAAVFFLFGATDATARFVPALFGAALVGMPFLLRRQIGMPAVLIAAVLLTFSPTLLYFSRFLRNDVYLAVWSLALVVCVWRYLDEQKERYLYAMAAVLALSFATKEVTFITVAIFLIFLDLMFAVELGRRREGEVAGAPQIILRTLAIAPVSWLIAAAVPVLPGRFFGLRRLPPTGDVLLLFGLLSLPQFAAAIQVLPFVTNHGYQASEEDTLRVVTVIALLVAAAYGGLLWRPRVFVVAAICFFVPYVLLYTTFFTNIDGFFSGIWGSLDYWLDQHHVRRGNQPGYYYALLTPLYEFLPMLLAFAGAAWMLVRGGAFNRWLLFWAGGTFFGLTLAGEKMPWLETHIALPLALIAAAALAKAVEALELTGRRWFGAAGAAATSALAVLLVVEGGYPLQLAGGALFTALGVWLIASLLQDPPRGLLSGLPRALSSTELHVTVIIGAAVTVMLALLSAIEPLGVDPYAAVWAAAFLPFVLAGYLVGHLMLSSKAFGRGALAIAVAALLTLTVRASLTASFENDDTPVEMLVYTQTSPEIPRIRDRIDSLSEASGLGYNLPIVVDNQDSFAWPWAWYLRDYHEVTFTTISEDYAPPANAVLLVNRSNTSFIDGSGYSQAPYKHRWWFNETYRGLDFQDAAGKVTSLDSLESLGRFFLYRRSVSNTGSIDGVAFFPLTLSAFDNAPAPQLAPREPARLADGRIVIGTGDGSPGGAPGELSQPADLFVGPAGNLWVADGLNNRLQQFDAEGNFIAQVTGSASPQGIREPWSVAVDAGGNIYVADTWNHRIQKFGPDLSFMMSWGQPGVSSDDPLTLFGPRDIAVASDGTLWVTDTGNNRLLHFAADGEPLGLIGAGEGVSFSEPVGVAFDSTGGLVVTDTWSGRILLLSNEGEVRAEIDAGWTSREVRHKPYVAVLAGGRILVTHPESGRLLLFDASGERLGEWQPLADSVPVGVAAMEDGGFAFSDIARNEVQIVPAELVGGFFE